MPSAREAECKPVRIRITTEASAESRFTQRRRRECRAWGWRCVRGVAGGRFVRALARCIASRRVGVLQRDAAGEWGRRGARGGPGEGGGD